MRLIDRDEMLSPKIWDMNIPNDIPKEVHDSLFELYNRLIHIPTVDAKPIRHGHWIDEDTEEAGGIYTYIRCSVCGDYMFCDSIGQIIETPYCPWCGAKMDEVEE